MKFIQNLRLKFPKVELEQHYKALKEENIIKDFNMCIRFLFLLNLLIFAFSIADRIWLEVYISSGTLIVMLILHIMQRYIKNHIQCVTLTIILIYNISRLILIELYYHNSGKVRMFFSGYGLASIQCILLLRLPRTSHKVYGMIAALVLRFVFFSVYVEPGSFLISVFLRHFLIDAFIIYTIYAYEVVFRKVYQNFVQKKEELLKFKEFIAESLPQSLVVITHATKEHLFSNRAFQETFESDGETYPVASMMTKNSLRTNLSSLHVDLSTIRETGTAYFNSTFLAESNTKSLDEILEKLRLDGHFESKTISLSASISQKNNRKLFEVTIKKVKWDSEDALAILFNDITYQENLIALKMSNINKDKVIATVSHELRTPLNGIIGILDITEKKVMDTEVSEYISLCKDNAHLLLSLVNSILDLQQISAGKLKLNPININLRNVIKSIRQLFSFQCKQKNIYLDTEIHTDVPVLVYTDENRLKQVLINLIGNAIKFTCRGGIKIEVVPHPDKADSLEISVTDTGIGIKQEDQKCLFRMYGKIEDGESVNKNGVGLGLTISNALVALLNGNIENSEIKIVSEYGVGSRFSFDLQKNFQDQKRLATKQSIEVVIEAKRNMTTTSNEHENETTRGILAQKTWDKADEEQEDNFGDVQQSECDEFFSPVKLQSKSSFQSYNRINMPTASLLPGTRRFNVNLRISSERVVTCLEEDQNGFKMGKDINKSGVKIDTVGYDSSAQILIVDDNPFNLLVAKSLIQDFGYAITTALGGQEAIDIVTKSASEEKAFKIIFMDCQMPIMDGFETTKALRTLMERGEVPTVPIYGWTANNSEEDVKRCFEAGMMGHLPKPAKKEDIRKVISEL